MLKYSINSSIIIVFLLASSSSISKNPDNIHYCAIVLVFLLFNSYIIADILSQLIKIIWKKYFG